MSQAKRPEHMVCANCMAFAPFAGEYAGRGGCRRYAPRAGAPVEASRPLFGLGAHPLVLADHWCLDFVPDMPTQVLFRAQTVGGAQ